jgi:hypothetical protein
LGWWSTMLLLWAVPSPRHALVNVWLWLCLHCPMYLCVLFLVTAARWLDLLMGKSATRQADKGMELFDKAIPTLIAMERLVGELQQSTATQGGTTRGPGGGGGGGEGGGGAGGGTRGGPAGTAVSGGGGAGARGGGDRGEEGGGMGRVFGGLRGLPSRGADSFTARAGVRSGHARSISEDDFTA